MATAIARRNAEATRAHILAAARQLLVDGDGDFEMSWVAKAAGVSQGLAYHHFGSKEGLLSAVVNDFYDRVEDAVLMARLDDYSDWEARERERVRRYIEFLTADPLAVKVFTRLAGTAAVAAVEATRWEQLVATGAKNMAEGQARGTIDGDYDPGLLAAMALGAVRSAAAREFSKKRPADPAQLTDAIWGFIRRGIGLEATA